MRAPKSHVARVVALALGATPVAAALVAGDPGPRAGRDLPTALRSARADEPTVKDRLNEALATAKREIDSSRWEEAERALKTAAELFATDDAKKLPDREAFAKRIEDLRQVLFVRANRDVTAGGAVKAWEKCKEVNGKESEGWENEKAPPSYANFLERPVFSLLAELTEKHHALGQRWLDQDRIKVAIQSYPDDAELKKSFAEVQKVREEAGGKLCSFAQTLLDQAEEAGPRHPKGDPRRRLAQLVGYLDVHAQGAALHPVVTGRAKAILEKWEKADPGHAAREALEKKMTAAAAASWPALVASYEKDVVKLEPSSVFADVDPWKTKSVRLSAPANLAGKDYWEDRFDLVTLVAGAPVVARLDSGLEEAILAIEKQTGVAFDTSRFAYEDLVAVVDNVVKVERRLPNPMHKGDSIRAGWTDAVSLRIVALKAGPYALACGQGTSIDKLEGQTPVAVDESGAFGRGALGNVFAR